MRADIAEIEKAIPEAHRGRSGAVVKLQPTISDPLPRKLVEWALPRANDNEADSCSEEDPASLEKRSPTRFVERYAQSAD